MKNFTTIKLPVEYPEKVKQMEAIWEEWARENFVYPLDGRGWNEKIEASR